MSKIETILIVTLFFLQLIEFSNFIFGLLGNLLIQSIPSIS